VLIDFLFFVVSVLLASFFQGYNTSGLVGSHTGFESDGNARECRSRSFLYNGNVVPVVFFCTLQLLTVIFHGSPSVIKLIRLLPAFLHVNNTVCRV